MGRGPTNENTNMYFQARKKAATYNERLWSREGAAELLGISVSTLADYELGNTKVQRNWEAVPSGRQFTMQTRIR